MSRSPLEEAINSTQANASALRKIDELITEVLNLKPTYGDTMRELYRLEARQDLALEIRDILDTYDVYEGLDI